MATGTPRPDGTAPRPANSRQTGDRWTLLPAPADRYLALVEATAETLFRLSPDGAEMWSLQRRGAPDEAPGAGWMDRFVPTDEQPRLRDAIAAALRTRTDLDLAHRVRRADGTVGWARSRAVPVVGPDGEIAEWFGVSADLTDQHHTEEAAQSSAARALFRAAFTDAVRAVQTPEGVQAEAARHLGRFLGVSRAFYAVVASDDVHAVIRDDYTDGQASIAGTHVLGAYSPRALDAYLAGRTLVQPDVQGDATLSAAERARYAGIGVAAFVSVPLVKDGRLAALFTVHQDVPRAWTPDEVALVEETAERTWSAVERRRAEQEVRELNATLEARVAERTREVRRLAARLANAEQAERQRIAHVLHDDLQQQLYGLSIVLNVARRQTDLAPDTTASLDQAETMIATAIQTARTLATDLSPGVLESEAFEDALHFLAASKRDAYGMEVHVEARGPLRVPDMALRIMLYQTLREVLFNVLKHAGVRSARLVGRAEAGEVVVEVADDGAGFDPGTGLRARGFGLFSVRERLKLAGGRFEVASAPGRGTRVTLAVPVADDVARQAT